MNIAHVLAVRVLHHILLGLTVAATKTSAHSCEAIGSQEMVHLLKLMELPYHSSIIIIQECYIGQSMEETIDNWAVQEELVMMSFHISNFDDVMPHLVKDVLSKKKLSAYRSMLNFVVFCDDCLLRIHEMIARTIYEYTTQTLLRHFSKWLFIYMEETTEGLPSLNTVLDNVAIAFKRVLVEDNSRTNSEDSEMKDSQLLESVKDAGETDGFTDRVLVKTLLWNPGGRHWSDVRSLIQPSHIMHVSGPLFPNTEYGLNGRELKIGALEWTTYCRRSQTQDNASVSYTQVCRDICDYLSISLNFSYVFVEPPDHSWGERLPNSSWSGLLGMTVRNEIDFSGLPFGQSTERDNAMSFSAMIMSSRYQICYEKPNSERNDWASLVSCFKWEVYACGLTALLCYIGLLSLMEMTATGRQQEICAGDLSQAAFTGISVPLHQGTDYQPGNLSGRILYVSWWMFCMVITAVYTGNLVAFLAVSNEKIPFTTLEELADNEEYGLIVFRGSYIESLLRFSNSSTMKVLWEKAMASRTSNFSNSFEEYDYHKRLMLSGKYAILTTSRTADDLTMTISELRRMSRDVISLPMSLPFPRDSPLELIVSEKIRSLYQAGMMDGLEKKWSIRKPTTQDEVTSGSQLQIADLQTAFIACAAGVFVATVCLAVEHTCNHAKLQHCRPLS